MIVHNETSLTGEEAVTLLTNSLIRDTKRRYIFLALILILGVFILVFSIVSKQKEFITLGAVVTALGIGFIVYSFIDLKKSRKRIIKNNPEISELGVSYIYKFKENSVQINAKIGSKNKKADYSYQFLKSITEFDDIYELVFNENNTVYVSKSGFENERMEEFFRKNITTTKKKIKYKGEKRQ